MKRFITYLMCFAAMSALALSCQDEIAEVGQPDADDCYGVYFASSSVSAALVPGEDYVYSLPVYRSVSEGAIVVPFEVSGDDVFSFGEIVFADGESEAELVIEFPEAEVGVTYSCEITISDPQYASLYSSNVAAVSFSALVEKWNSLGYGLYREDILTTFYGVGNQEYYVEILENDSKAGLYRLVNAYGEVYPWNDEGDWDDSKDYYLEINACSSSQVYIECQTTELDWGYGQVIVWSLADYYVQRYGYTLADVSSYCGSLSGGIITFPTSSLLICMPDYSSSYYTANGSGMFRVVLPGVSLADYSVSISVGYSEEGLAPCYIACGDEVEAIKYCVYEGTLSASQVETRISNIGSGAEESASDFCYPDEYGYVNLEVSCEASGIYTIVVCSFAAEEEGGELVAQDGDSCQFSYLAADDEKPVEIYSMLYQYNRGSYNSDNCLAAQVYGEDITDAKVLLMRYNAFAKDPEGALESLYAESSIDVDLVNGDGWSAVYDGLVPGFEYILLVWATNDYEESVIYAVESTSGVLSLDLENDVCGVWNVAATSYWYGAYEEQWVIEPVEEFYDEYDARYYNLALTQFGEWENVCVYGYYDAESASIGFADWACFYTDADLLSSWYGEDYADYLVDFYFFSYSSDYVVAQFTSDTEFSISDWMGIYMYYYPSSGDSYSSLGWYDMYISVSAEKAAAEEEVVAAAAKRASVVRTEEPVAAPVNSIQPREIGIECEVKPANIVATQVFRTTNPHVFSKSAPMVNGKAVVK